MIAGWPSSRGARGREVHHSHEGCVAPPCPRTDLPSRGVGPSGAFGTKSRALVDLESHPSLALALNVLRWAGGRAKNEEKLWLREVPLRHEGRGAQGVFPDQATKSQYVLMSEGAI